MKPTQQQVEEFVGYYNVKPSRMQSVINALIEIGCTSDLLQNALDDQGKRIKNLVKNVHQTEEYWR